MPCLKPPALFVFGIALPFKALRGLYVMRDQEAAILDTVCAVKLPLIHFPDRNLRSCREAVSATNPESVQAEESMFESRRVPVAIR
jgi:hypothetical protein